MGPGSERLNRAMDQVLWEADQVKKLAYELMAQLMDFLHHVDTLVLVGKEVKGEQGTEKGS